MRTLLAFQLTAYDRVAFNDLQHGDVDIGSVVAGITNGRMSGRNLVDPAPNFDTYRHRKDRPAWQQ